MRLQELVLCTTAPNSSEPGAGYVALHDIQNAANLASFKQTNARNHCTAVFESTNRQGGFILAAQPDKSILNVYNFQKVGFLLFHWILSLTRLVLGSDCAQNCSSRKVDMSRH